MRFWLPLVLACAFLLAPHATAQTTYPDRPIKMIVPLAAASAVDVAARIVTQKMAQKARERAAAGAAPDAIVAELKKVLPARSQAEWMIEANVKGKYAAK